MEQKEAGVQEAGKDDMTLRAEKDARVDAILAETAAAKQTADTAPAERKNAADDEEEHLSLMQILFDAADLMESVITSIFTVMLIFAFLFCTANVDGDSMLPTLENGDRLIVSRLDKNFENGDILIVSSIDAYLFDEAGALYSAPGLDKRIVKRLIGKAGDEVNIDFTAGKVFVNGEELDEPYISALTKRDYGAFHYPIVVPEGYVFVLGDNRPISKDSRHPEVGLVPVGDVVGKVVLRISPFSKFGKIEPVIQEQ